MGDKVLAGALCATGLTFVVAVLFSAFAATGKGGTNQLNAITFVNCFDCNLIGWPLQFSV